MALAEAKGVLISNWMDAMKLLPPNMDFQEPDYFKIGEKRDHTRHPLIIPKTGPERWLDHFLDEKNSWKMRKFRSMWGFGVKCTADQLEALWQDEFDYCQKEDYCGQCSVARRNDMFEVKEVILPGQLMKKVMDKKIFTADRQLVSRKEKNDILVGAVQSYQAGGTFTGNELAFAIGIQSNISTAPTINTLLLDAGWIYPVVVTGSNGDRYALGCKCRTKSFAVVCEMTAPAKEMVGQFSLYAMMESAEEDDGDGDNPTHQEDMEMEIA
jgi:hypothetical protein